MPNQKWAEAPVPHPDEELAAPLLESLSWASIYVGSREALIAAGLVIDGQFPGDPGRARKTQHYRGPPDWRIDRRGPDRYSVRLPRSVDTTSVAANTPATPTATPAAASSSRRRSGCRSRRPPCCSAATAPVETLSPSQD
jgi:hypothetical protein